MSTESRHGVGRPGLILISLSLALFMVFLDTTVVNIALASIQRDLGGGIDQLQWIIDAYTLTFACFLLTSGVLGDRLGYRAVFVFGLGLFTVASLACALAPNAAVLLAARAAQGLGGSIVMPVSLGAIIVTFPDTRSRSRAIGVWSGVGSLALAAGPMLGGWLVERYGWQSIFWINVVPGVVTVCAAARLLPGRSSARSVPRLDVAGQAGFALSVCLMTLSLIEANRWGWASARTIGGLACAVLVMAWFLLRQVRSTHPLLPVSWLRQARFGLPNVVGLCSFFGLLGAIFSLTLYLQNLRGLSPVETGLRFLPLTVSVCVMSLVAAAAATRWNAMGLMVLGLVMVAGGLGGVARLDVDTPYTRYWWALALLGSGIAFCVTPGTVMALAQVDDARSGTAGGILNTSRQLGGVLGVAVMGSVMLRHFEGSVGQALASVRLPAVARARLVAGVSNGDLSGIRELPPAIRAPVAAAVRGAFAGGVRAAAVTGVIVTVTCAVLLIMAWWALWRSERVADPAHDGRSARAGIGAAQARQVPQAVQLIESGRKTGDVTEIMPTTLSAIQMLELRALITENNPHQLGLGLALWTREMIGELIRQRFGVILSRVTVGLILKKLGMYPQQPLFRAYQQNPEKVQEWKEKTYLEIREEAARRGAVIFFADEAAVPTGFHPGTMWGLTGQIPVVTATGERKSVMMVSAISPYGELRFHIQEGTFRASDFIDFCKQLMQDMQSDIFLIVDRISVYASGETREFVQSTGGKLRLFFLPSYSPKLNPDEWVWKNGKHDAIGRSAVRGVNDPLSELWNRHSSPGVLADSGPGYQWSTSSQYHMARTL